MFVIRVGLFLNEIIQCDLCFFFFLSLSLSKKTYIYIFIGVAYFNHAANLYWITEEKK